MHKDQMRELNEAVRSCRAAGKKKDFNGVLKSAEAALELIQSDNNAHQFRVRALNAHLQPTIRVGLCIGIMQALDYDVVCKFNSASSFSERDELFEIVLFSNTAFRKLTRAS